MRTFHARTQTRRNGVQCLVLIRPKAYPCSLTTSLGMKIQSMTPKSKICLGYFVRPRQCWIHVVYGIIMVVCMSFLSAQVCSTKERHRELNCFGRMYLLTVGRTGWEHHNPLITHFVSSKVTVELSLRADKESKDGDQIPIQFVVRFAGMSTLSFPLDLKLDTRRKERRQRSRLFNGHHSHG